MNSKYRLLSPIIFLLVLFLAPTGAGAINVEVTVTATVLGCGDGIIQTGEQCEGANLSGASCITQGFIGGTLSCTALCTFNTSSCVSGGRAHIPQIPTTNVVFVGKAYPKSAVTLLKDGQMAATTVADANADFQTVISGLAGGNYVFSIYAEDWRGVKSPLFTFPIKITPNLITKISNIFIAPTITLDKSEAGQGEKVTISGQSTPVSRVNITSAGVKGEFTVQKTSDVLGRYSLDLDTSLLAAGQYSTKSKTISDGQTSPVSEVMTFNISPKSTSREKLAQPLRPAILARGDLNGDGRVNLTDFSIMAYWYGRPFSLWFESKEKELLSGDGKIDLVDFSIMAFYWTG